MTNEYYPTIFKRKSFHLFRDAGNAAVTAEELQALETAYASFERLCPEIRTAIRIVPAAACGDKRDAEYCILLYSEKKENYLLNAGYLGEQLDLWLVQRNIGSLWYGLGKPDEPAFDGLDYVIMIAIHKVEDPAAFRKDMFKAARKPLPEIWTGDGLGVAEIARFAPSACNSQPWRVDCDDGVLAVNRYRSPGRVGLMSPASAFYFNRIDMGIFLCILEICLAEKGISAERHLFPDETDNEMNQVAEYRIG